MASMRGIETMRRAAVAGALALALISMSAFATPARADSGTHTVNIFAASSLTKAYTALADNFQRAFPKIKVNLVFGSSSTLATQITTGAPADIFASADVASMSAASAEFPSPTNYVTNQVILAVPTNSAITSFAGLNGATKWLQCGHSVPCGIAADAGLKADGVVTSTPISYEGSDASALAKLLAGTVDAALIFKTDVIANPTKLRAIAFTHSEAANSQYQIAISQAKATVKNPWVKTVYSYFTATQAKIFLKQSGFVVKP
jgi:molybdate transport system substrate-binding protein